MNKYTDFLLNLLAQFGGGRGGDENELVRFGLAAALWGMLLFVALNRLRQKKLRHEKFLAWGFGLGFAREMLMFIVFSMQMLNLISHERLHVLFPPLEHSLSMAAVIVVAAAFLRYINKDILLSRRYLQAGLWVAAFCYLATFWWWAEFITANPSFKFGQTWADWLFRISACILIGVPVILLLRKPHRLSYVVAAALGLFFLDEFLMLFNLAGGDVHKEIYGPVRHVLHISAIPLLGYVYIRELSLDLKDESEISSSLLQMFETINAGHNEKQLVRNVMNIAPKYLKFDKFSILLREQNPGGLMPAGFHGFSPDGEKTLSSMHFKSDAFSFETQAGKPIIVKDANNHACPFIRAFNVKSAALMPVPAGGKIKGLLIGGYEDMRPVRSRDAVLLKGLSDGLSIAFQNASLYEELQSLLINTITSFASAIDAKSPWTRGHSERVTNYSVAIGDRMGLDDDALEKLRLGGLLHDIGKIGTYDIVLDKPGKLT